MRSQFSNGELDKDVSLQLINLFNELVMIHCAVFATEGVYISNTYIFWWYQSFDNGEMCQVSHAFGWFVTSKTHA